MQRPSPRYANRPNTLQPLLYAWMGTAVGISAAIAILLAITNPHADFPIGLQAVLFVQAWVFFALPVLMLVSIPFGIAAVLASKGR